MQTLDLYIYRHAHSCSNIYKTKIYNYLSTRMYKKKETHRYPCTALQQLYILEIMTPQFIRKNKSCMYLALCALGKPRF